MAKEKHYWKDKYGNLISLHTCDINYAFNIMLWLEDTNKGSDPRVAYIRKRLNTEKVCYATAAKTRKRRYRTRYGAYL